MNDKIKTAIDFVSRHAVWFIIGFLAFIFMKPGIAEIQTFLFIAFFEAVAIGLSSLALFGKALQGGRATNKNYLNQKKLK